MRLFQANIRSTAAGSDRRLETARAAARRERRRRLVHRGCWLYCAALMGLTILLRSAADRWWPATVLMFGPRWLCALPLLVLGPLALFICRKALWSIALSLAIIMGPLTGLCIPWRTLTSSQSSAGRIRVLSCNTHYSQLDARALGLLILETKPDIVALQGWTSNHQRIVFLEDDWQIRRDRELCLGSRFPIRKVQESADPAFHDGWGALARYQLESPFGTIHFINLHLASPREALEAAASRPFEAKTLMSANSETRRRQSAIAQRWALEVNEPILLAGDFNTPTDSTISREFWSPFHNAFSEGGTGWGYTFFTRRSAVRIDHQLGGPGWQCRRCWVGPDVGSPHRPVIADWHWMSSATDPTPP